MNKRKLQIEQLDKKMRPFYRLADEVTPSSGWIRNIRLSLGMSLQQLAEKLGITKQSVSELEHREQEGSVTVKSLREAADALDMKLVYGMVPKDGTLDALIERKAKAMADRIVSRTSRHMQLEDQGISESRRKKAIEERTSILKNEMPKALWD